MKFGKVDTRLDEEMRLSLTGALFLFFHREDYRGVETRAQVPVVVVPCRAVVCCGMVAKSWEVLHLDSESKYKKVQIKERTDRVEISGLVTRGMKKALSSVTSSLVQGARTRTTASGFGKAVEETFEADDSDVNADTATADVGTHVEMFTEAASKEHHFHMLCGEHGDCLQWSPCEFQLHGFGWCVHVEQCMWELAVDVPKRQ